MPPLGTEICLCPLGMETPSVPIGHSSVPPSVIGVASYPMGTAQCPLGLGTAKVGKGIGLMAPLQPPHPMGGLVVLGDRQEPCGPHGHPGPVARVHPCPHAQPLKGQV